jgi:hypothetical protein
MAGQHANIGMRCCNAMATKFRFATNAARIRYEDADVPLPFRYCACMHNDTSRASGRFRRPLIPRESTVLLLAIAAVTRLIDSRLVDSRYLNDTCDHANLFP